MVTSPLYQPAALGAVAAAPWSVGARASIRMVAWPVSLTLPAASVAQ
jgi:hypothetical protein